MSTALLAESHTGFRALGLPEPILTALESARYLEPTPIQAALIPEALAGRDVIGQAQTGTGKTAAFLLPFFSCWRDNLPEPQAIVLAPTRELVVQVSEEANRLTPSPQCRALAIYGGQRVRKQQNDLKRGASLIIGTPGRVLDHLARGSLSLESIRYVVLDEADRMLDIGFRPDIEKILRRCPRQRQTLLLSATVPSAVLRLSNRYMIDPILINVSPEKATVEAIRQSYITVDEDRKFELLLRLIDQEKPRQSIIFCERKLWAENLYRDLRHHVQRVAVIHGDLDQTLRNRIMQGFREGKIMHLVATDVVGRGIDVKGISHVFNYDLPEDPENYVHRIGRTGRIGADGIAIAFATPDQGRLLTNIETFINRELETLQVPEFQAALPRTSKEESPKDKPITPVFGRRIKKYSNRI